MTPELMSRRMALSQAFRRLADQIERAETPDEWEAVRDVAIVIDDEAYAMGIGLMRLVPMDA